MNPAKTSPLFHSAIEAYERGDAAHALTLCEDVLRQDRGHCGALYLSGTLLMAGRKPDLALPRLEAAKRMQPQNPELLHMVGDAYFALERWQDAVAAYQSAWHNGRHNSDLLNNLGLAFKEIGNVDAAVSAYREALRHTPDDADIHNNLAIALNRQQDYEGAIAAYRRSTEIDPSNVAVWGNLATLYEQSNMLEETAEVLRRALVLDPGQENLQLIAARCERREGKLEQAVQRLESQLSTSSLNLGVRRAMEFELGRNYDILGRADRALEHFMAGNGLTPQVWPGIRIGADAVLEDLTQQLKSTSPDWVAKLPASPLEDRPSPVFLVGFPRSGTTLMDTMLDAHPSITVMEEIPILDKLAERLRALPGGYPGVLPNLGTDQIYELRDAYWREASAVLGHDDREKLVLDKNPFYSVHAAFIHQLFPSARFIFALRHPCDVVLSCFMQAFGNNPTLENFRNLENSAITYDRVMQLWLRYRQHLPLKVHELRYEALVADKRRELDDLLAFLSLDWQEELEDHTRHAKKRGRIYTPSYHQVIKPVYKDSLDRWQRYRPYFGTALETLKPYVESFGYRLD